MSKAQPGVFDDACERVALLTKDNRINVWDAASSKLRVQCVDLKNNLAIDYTCLAWGHEQKHDTSKSPKRPRKDHQMVAVGTSKGSIIVWDVSKAEILFSLNTQNEASSGNINDLFLAPDGRTLLTCANDGKLAEWDLSTKEPRHSWKGDKQAVNKIILSSSGDIIASGGTSIKLWDRSSYNLTKKFTPHASAVNCMQFSPDGKYLLTSASDRLINLYDCQAQAGSDAIRVFAADSPPLSLFFNFNFLNKKTHHFMALTESGAVNVWSVDKKERNLQAAPAQGLFYAVDPAQASKKQMNGKKDRVKRARLLSAQFSSQDEIIIVAGSESEPIFRTTKYHVAEAIKSTEISLDRIEEAAGSDDEEEEKQEEEQEREAKKQKTTSKRLVTSESAVPFSGIERKETKARELPKNMLVLQEFQDSRHEKQVSGVSILSSLQQAIHLNDSQMLTNLLLQDDNIISDSVRRLESKYVLPLLKHLVVLIRAQPGCSKKMYTHVRNLISSNVALLLSTGAMQECATLQAILEGRLQNHSKLMFLKGRLDLLLAHIDRPETVKLDTQNLQIYKGNHVAKIKKLTQRKAKKEEPEEDSDDVVVESDIDDDDSEDESSDGGTKESNGAIADDHFSASEEEDLEEAAEGEEGDLQENESESDEAANGAGQDELGSESD